MKFENKGLPEVKHETIETITLAEYHDLPEEAQEWIQMNEDVPSLMWEKIATIDSSVRLIDVLRKIRTVRAEVCNNERSNSPKSFEDSRFTSFEEVIKRNLDSCGVGVRVFGTTLRKLGIPVRFVDGKHIGDQRIDDHAWLDIYSPKDGSWIECDPGKKNFERGDRNRRERVFHDWDELKAVHVKASR